MATAKGVFVTGTGTEVGKTVVAAVHRPHTLRPKGIDRGGLQAGGDGSRRTRRDRPRACCAAPPAPSRATRRSRPTATAPPPRRTSPRPRPVRRSTRRACRSAASDAAASADVLVCEGVGGLLVPLAWRVRSGTRDNSPGLPSARPGGRSRPATGHRRLARTRHDQPHAADPRGRPGPPDSRSPRSCSPPGPRSRARSSAPTERRSRAWATCRCRPCHHSTWTRQAPGQSSRSIDGSTPGCVGQSINR